MEYAILLLAVIAGSGVLIFLLVRRMLDRLSGWNGLAARFAAPQPPPAWHWKHQTMRVGAVRYRRSMQLAALPEGLYLGEAGLMNHPILCIPWHELRNPTHSRFYGRAAIRLEAGPGSVELPVELYQALMGSAAARS